MSEEPVQDGAAGRGGGRRFLLTLVGVVFLVGICSWFGVKTEAARKVAEGQLSDAAGMPMRVGAMRLGLPGALILESIESDGFDGNAPGLRVAMLVVKPRLPWGLRVVADRPEVRLVVDAAGDWAPGCVSALGDLPSRDLSAISGLTDEFRRRLSLSLRKGRFQWLDAGGAELALAEGVDFDLENLSVGGSPMRYHRVRADRVSWTGDGKELQGEWLAGTGRPFVDLQGGPGGDSKDVPPLRDGEE